MNIFKENWKKYQERGFNPLPAKGKTPSVAWNSEFKPSGDLYEEWEKAYSGENLLLYLGERLAVLHLHRLDTGLLESLNLPKCPVAVSGNGSTHYYFKVSKPVEPFKVRNANGGFLEIRTGNMGVLGPPSLHPETKKAYRWAEGKSLKEIAIPELTMSIYERLRHLDLKKPENEKQATLKTEQPEAQQKTASPKCTAPVVEQKKKDLPFPKEAIGGLAREFADLYSTCLESPWSFFAFNFLTCLGNLIADRVTLVSQIEPEPRLYTVLVAESADDRKSESIKQTIRFFEPLENFEICNGVGSAEGLASILEDESRELLLVFDELKTFVSKSIIDGSVLLPAVNSFFDGNSFHSATKHHKIELDDVHLSILAACTEETFQRMWSSAFTDIGFLNRLWIVKDHGHRKFCIPQEIPLEKTNALRDKLKEVLAKIPSKEKKKLTITEKALSIFNDWYMGLEEHSPYTKRLDTYGHRLMILLAVNEGQTEIAPEIAEKIVKLLRWQLEVRRETAPIDAEGIIARMEEKIRRKLWRGPLSERDLKRAVNYSKDGLWVWKNAFKNLKEGKELVVDPKSGMVSLTNSGEMS